MTVPDHAANLGYGALAPFYDAFTDHPGYADWIRGLAGLAREHGADGDRVLDVACGTGKSLAPLLEQGLTGVGVDAVPGMAAVARERLDATTPVLVSDMTCLPELGAFDLALCVNDAVNCLLTPEAVAAAMRSIAANLRPGGVLVFDTSTPVAYRDHFAVKQRRDVDGMAFRWNGTYDGDRAVATLDVAADHGDRPLARAVHVQRHHPDAVIERALAGAGLETLARYGQHDDGTRSTTVDADHFKAVHVVKRTVHPLS
jgi:SAM-dependent methyltransferase